MNIDPEKIGIIAGGGQLPLLFAHAASQAGLEVYAAAHEGETDRQLAHIVTDLQWVKLGQLGRIIKFFTQKSAFTPEQSQIYPPPPNC